MTQIVPQTEVPDTDVKAAGEMPVFQALRNKSPHLATGLIISLMMGHASFANRPFGGICSLIAGHVNRGHYFIVFRGNVPRGFVGWAFDTETAAQAWLDGDGTLTGNGQTGDCVIFNFWVTDGPDMNSFLVRTLRQHFHDKRRLMARRIYSDGRVRPLTIRNTRN